MELPHHQETEDTLRYPCRAGVSNSHLSEREWMQDAEQGD